MTKASRKVRLVFSDDVYVRVNENVRGDGDDAHDRIHTSFDCLLCTLFQNIYPGWFQFQWSHAVYHAL